MTELQIIVARSQNGVIGANGTMPWHLPEDLKHFKTVTMGAPVIMGRVTHESIGRPLPGRENIVITRQKDFSAPGCRVVASIADAIDAVKDLPKAFIIGGAQIYKTALDAVDTCWVTEIEAEIEGDAFFPELPCSVWQKEVLSRLEADGKRPALSFCIYRRK